MKDKTNEDQEIKYITPPIKEFTPAACGAIKIFLSTRKEIEEMFPSA